MIFQVDIQLETGEYFLSDKKKSAKKWQERQAQQAEKTAENKRKRDESFVPPKVLRCFFLHFHKFMSFILLYKFLRGILSNFYLHSLGTCKSGG